MSELARGSSTRAAKDAGVMGTRIGQVAVGAGILAAMVLWLRLVGRPFICPCGTIELFAGDADSPMNSQQFSDWYSALHVVFGFGLFAFLQRMRPHWPLGRKILVTIASSAVWEAMENMPIVIAMFGAPKAPLYAGDSILNATADTLFVVIGFLIARALPMPAVAALAVATEVVVSLAIGDGFALATLRLVGVPI